MALGRRRRGGEPLNAWPGYVDALSTLLMVIIFVLLVFVLAQGFLAVSLSSRDRAVERLSRQVSELTELLALERGQAEELRAALGRADGELRGAAAARDGLARAAATLREERDRLLAEREATRLERERLAARLVDLDLAAGGGAARIAELEQRLAEALARAEQAGGDTARTQRALTEAQRLLVTERRALEEARRTLADGAAASETAARERAALAAALARLREEQAALMDRLAAAERDRDAAAQRLAATERDRDAAAQRLAAIEGERDEAARRAAGIVTVQAQRDQLEAQAAAALARTAEAERRRDAARSAQAAAESRAELADARASDEAARRAAASAEVTRLAGELAALREEMRRAAAALALAEEAGRGKDTEIASLGRRLNVALAARVEELEQYRSDFFGRLRGVLGERPELRIVGDRFVFQSEVLFPAGSAEMAEGGQAQMRSLARVLLDLAAQFPPDLQWVLRIDGHADRTPLRGGRFANNWELSAARALAVAQLLIGEGVPPNRIAAAAFGDTQPLDEGDTAEALARNRRIELRLEPVPGATPMRAASARALAAPTIEARATRPEPRQVLQEVVGQIACARLAIGEEAGALRVAGLARRGAEADIREALQAREADPARLAFELRPVDGTYCGVVEALRDSPAAPLRAELSGRQPLPRGAALRLDLGLPDWATQVVVHRLAANGQAIRLARLERPATAGRLRLGEPRGGERGWVVEEPLGSELLLVLAAEAPLPSAARPAREPLEGFAAALEEALAAARREGKRVAVQLVPLETVAR